MYATSNLATYICKILSFLRLIYSCVHHYFSINIILTNWLTHRGITRGEDRWATDLSVSGVPANANQAQVLNLSLGVSGSCSTTEQNAINEIVATGTTVVVVAARNSNLDASGSSPANCSGVITVAANDRNGDKAFYSNFGSSVEVTAPGGETTIFGNGVLSTLDDGAMRIIREPAWQIHMSVGLFHSFLLSTSLDFYPFAKYNMVVSGW